KSGAIANVAVDIVAPAFPRAVGEQGAGVLRPGGDPRYPAQAAYRHRDARGGRGAIAQLASAVVAPAFDGGVGKQGAGVDVPDGNLDSSPDRQEVSRDHNRGCNLRSGRGGVAQLAKQIVAPAFDVAAGKQR